MEARQEINGSFTAKGSKLSTKKNGQVICKTKDEDFQQAKVSEFRGKVTQKGLKTGDVLVKPLEKVENETLVYKVVPPQFFKLRKGNVHWRGFAEKMKMRIKLAFADSEGPQVTPATTEREELRMACVYNEAVQKITVPGAV
uniref:Uncharacterized protein n=1 Tax=Arundo donax TaxID=35708 RepID=A0A0A8XWY8_ARUDO